MMTLNRVLVALDGSPTAEAILPHVKGFLRRHDSELILVRAVPVTVVKETMPTAEPVVAEARAYLAGVKDRLVDAGARVTVEVRVGPPAGVLLDVAEERQASLIAITTHGRTGVGRAVAGSVAEVVLRKSGVPVLSVRPVAGPGEKAAAATESGPVRGILVPTDLSAHSEAALDPAMSFAKLFEARLAFLHLLPSAHGRPENGGGDEAKARADLSALAGRARTQGIAAAEILDHADDVPHAILENARFHGCDLIAMATHGRTGLARMIAGSVAERVLRESLLPVLITRPKTLSEGATAAAAKAKR